MALNSRLNRRSIDILLRLALVFTWGLAAGLGSVLPTRAQAPGPEISELQIDLWPEYDDPRLLVIYKGRLVMPPDRALRFPIPAAAEVNAVAYLNSQDRLINVTWESQVSGELQIITFTPDTARFQIEYYVNLIPPGPSRSFSVDINVGDQPVKVLGIAVQQPAGASDLQGQPALSGPVVGFQGLSYYTRQVEDVQPGQTVNQTITYIKPDEMLSIDRIGSTAADATDMQPSSTDSASRPARSTNSTRRQFVRFWLPIGSTTLIIVGLAMFGYGIWRARTSTSDPGSSLARQRSRRSSRQRAVHRRPPEKFCHQCGTPFEPEDHFCAACGTPRRL